MVAYFRVFEPFTLTTSLINAKGNILESHTNWVAHPPDGLSRLRFDVPIYTRTPPGEYHFVLSSFLSKVPLDTPLRIVSPPLETVASITHPHDYQVGQSIHLEGYQSPTQVKLNGQLPVKLYWRTEDKVTERYTVFVQLVGTQFNPKTNGPLWAGHDSEPLDGGYPTTQWFVNVPIADTHVLAIPPETPPGEYELWAGMYTQPDIKRLPVYNAQGNLVGDHIVLGKVMVTK
jgi:hypothetical protein